MEKRVKRYQGKWKNGKWGKREIKLTGKGILGKRELWEKRNGEKHDHQPIPSLSLV